MLYTCSLFLPCFAKTRQLIHTCCLCENPTHLLPCFAQYELEIVVAACNSTNSGVTQRTLLPKEKSGGRQSWCLFLSSMMSVCGADISKFFWLIIFLMLTGFSPVVPEAVYVCSVSRGEGRRVPAYVSVILTPTRGWGERQRQTYIHMEGGWGRSGERVGRRTH